MIKRPLDPRFNDAVLAGVKTSTIRKSAWPLHTPIMLHNWTGKPYRSKHADVAAIRVLLSRPIDITHHEDGRVTYVPHAPSLWKSEGFPSPAAMDEWFRAVVKPGNTVRQTLMHFKLI